MGLFVLWLLLLFGSLPLDRCIHSFEHLIEKKTGEVICNRAMLVVASRGPTKYDMLQGAVAHFETL